MTEQPDDLTDEERVYLVQTGQLPGSFATAEELGEVPQPEVTRFDPAGSPHFTDVPWVAFCRRTNDPKLRFIEAWLDNLGVEHRRNGKSFHAPILEVPEDQHDFCYEQILMAHDEQYGIFDERPDDDPMFAEHADA